MTTSADPDAVVIVIDHNPSICEALAVAFEACQLPCNTFGEGGEALAFVRDHSPSVAIVAFHLPKANGAEVTRCLQLLQPSLTIIGTSTEHLKQTEMIDAGAADFFAKPFDMSRLITKVRLHVCTSTS